jgi:hypothetical protein
VPPARRPRPSPAVFAVVGEDRADPGRLLLLGADGRHYRYDLPTGTTAPVDPGADWVLDPDPPPAAAPTG